VCLQPFVHPHCRNVCPDPVFSLSGVFFGRYWCLNSEPHTRSADALPLEPLHQQVSRLFYSCILSVFKNICKVLVPYQIRDL
jgi:hypothetical protein